ncbi:MAG: O-antigen ligase family protein [Acidobacteriota bacterium]|nr:O-antigen ligase family protein [Acidobacteriota bacterium]
MIGASSRDAVLPVALSLVLLAGLPFGGTPTWWRCALALAIAAVLALVASDRRAKPRVPKALAALVAATSLLGALYLLPVPPTVLRALAPSLAARAEASLALPGEPAGLAEAERALVHLAGGERAEPSWRPLAADPDSAALGYLHLLLGLGALTVGLLAVRTTRDRRLFAGTLALTAAAQACYGLAEALSGHRHILHVPKVHFPELPSGTFVSPNHFAALISLGLFATIGLLLSRSGTPGAEGRDRIQGAARQVLLLTISAVIVIALAWSSSRAALASAGVAAVALGASLAWRGVRWSGSIVLRALACGALALLLIGTAVVVRPPEPLVKELGETPLGLKGRAEMARTTWTVIRENPLVGTGPGTYRWLHALHRPEGMATTTVHAHCDYLEWWSETGVAGVVLAIAWIAALVIGIAASVRHAPDRTTVVSMSAGLLALGLHETVDFSLRLPGVLVPAALLAGALVAPVPRGPTRRPPTPGPDRWTRPLAIGLATLLTLVGCAALAGHREIQLDEDPTGSVIGALSSAESQRRWARRRVDSVLAAVRGGRPPSAEKVVDQVGPAVVALQRAARRAPLRGEVRLTSWVASRTLLASSGTAPPDGERFAPLLQHYLTRAEELAPASRSRRQLLIKYWLLDGNVAEARRVARVLLEAAPDRAARVYQLLGGARLELADLMEATPNRARAALELADYLTRERDDRVGAQVVLERALSRHPDHEELRRQLVGTLHARKLYEPALEILAGGLPPSGRDDRLARMRLRAVILTRLQRWDGVESLIEELGREGEEPLRLELLRARTLLARDESDEALRILRSLVDGSPASLPHASRVDALVLIGRELERLNRLTEALAYYRRAQELDPRDPRVTRFFERLRRTTGTEAPEG